MDIETIKQLPSDSNGLVTIAAATPSTEIRDAAIEHMSEELLSEYFDALIKMLPDNEDVFKPSNKDLLAAKCSMLAAMLALEKNAGM